MESFYGTFMGKQAFRNNYVKIVAANEVLARDAMFTHFGGKFMTVYTAEQFSGQPEQFNLTELATIYVDGGGHGSFPRYELLTGEGKQCR